MLDSEKAAIIVGVARSGGVDPVALLAIVEIESRGKPFEDDNETPRFLFEKHQFNRQLQNNATEAARQRANAQGLLRSAFVKGGYNDQGTSEGRRRLLDGARAINEELANRSCSWGIGQIMGFNATGLGYASATDMVRQFSRSGQGFRGQVEGMMRFIQKNDLEKSFAKRDWATIARRYNGQEYRQNNYDQKLRAAYERWSNRTLPPPGYTPPNTDSAERAKILAAARMARGSSSDDVRDVQQKLTTAGYALGKIDGDYGAKTEAAVFTFQTANNLPATGIVDDATLAKLNSPSVMPIANGRRTATQADLLRLGSRTIKETRFGKMLATVLGLAGGGGLAESVYRAQTQLPEKGALEGWGNELARIGDKISGTTTNAKIPDVSASVNELNRITAQLRNYADQGQQFLTSADGGVSNVAGKMEAIRTAASELAANADRLRSAGTLTSRVKDFVNGKGGLLSNVEDARRGLRELQTGVNDLVVNRGDLPDVGELSKQLLALKDTLGSSAVVHDGVLGSVLKSGLLMLSPTNGLPVVALGVGLFMLRSFSQVRRLRVEDHQKGYNLGL